MALRFYSLVIDSSDRVALSRWWAQALDWRIDYEDDDEVDLVPRWMGEDDVRPRDQRMPILTFVSVPDAKTVKNRLHIDLAPDEGDDQAAMVQRLLDLGATRADIGQGEQNWVVLADPEGNEFCVLTSRD